jgi:hypothetical protein
MNTFFFTHCVHGKIARPRLSSASSTTSYAARATTAFTHHYFNNNAEHTFEIGSPPLSTSR